MYIKSHSMGEFVFDQQWAEAANQNGIDYYPKLLVGVPFTPATGPRILWSPAARANYTARGDIRQLRRAVGRFLRTVAQANGLSSVHVNFLTDEEATDLTGPLLEGNSNDEEDEGANFQRRLRSLFGKRFALPSAVKDDYLRRTSLQYHWVNVNPQTREKFSSFDEYLSCFKSKRRITIRRERARVLNESSIRVDAIVGSDILKYDGLVDRMYQIYKSTIDKMVWGRQYLSLDFFRRIAETSFLDNLCFLCARHKDSGDDFRADDVFAGTFSTCAQKRPVSFFCLICNSHRELYVYLQM
jgi:predicted N-acyltransferase